MRARITRHRSSRSDHLHTSVASVAVPRTLGDARRPGRGVRDSESREAEQLPRPRIQGEGRDADPGRDEPADPAGSPCSHPHHTVAANYRGDLPR